MKEEVFNNCFKKLISTIDYQEYFLKKEDLIYKIIVDYNGTEIFIKCKNYIISFNQFEFSILFGINFDSLNQSYEYIINLFEENKIEIVNIILNKEICININNNNKIIEIILKYNIQNNKDKLLIINEINKIKEEINNLKEENEKLKSEIVKFKEYHERTKPKDIKFLTDIVNDSYDNKGLDNAFIVFNSINQILYLIYSNKSKSIICYDLNENKK